MHRPELQKNTTGRPFARHSQKDEILFLLLNPTGNRSRPLQRTTHRFSHFDAEATEALGDFREGGPGGRFGSVFDKLA